MTNGGEKTFILEESTGKRWYFFLSEGGYIQYTYQEDGNWIQPTTLDRQVVKEFGATLDVNGKIHVVAYTLSKQLIYYTWDDEKWSSHTLYRVHSRFQSISFLFIVSSTSSVHIFYYLESSLRKSSEILVHYHLEENKWLGDKLWSFSSDDQTSPQSVFVDQNDNLHILYTKQIRNNHKLFYATYDAASEVWSTPALLLQSPNRIRHCGLLVDPNQNIHLVWKEHQENLYRICYTPVGQIDASISSRTRVVLYEGTDNPKYPALISLSALYAFWNTNGIVHYKKMESSDTWGAEQVLPSTQNHQMSYYYFTSYNYRDLSPSLGLWGVDYPNITLLAMDIPIESNEASTLQSHSSIFPSLREKTAAHSDLADETAQEIANLKTDYEGLQQSLSKISRQVNDLSSAIYLIQQKLGEKDKSYYQLETNLKRVSFELDQLMRRRASKAVESTPSRRYSPSKETVESSGQDSSETTAQDTPQSAVVQRSAESSGNTSEKVSSHENSEQSRTPSKEEVLPPERVHKGSYSIEAVEDISPRKQEPDKITLGNVSIIINSEDEDEHL